ncbi:TPA: hypothetical protein N0F65_001400 [Lagenidium giganteum]|uniref:Opsin n=1 Tax=Lagenidium giganteum TaxID=4803 RepID=A0AAV2YY14_9STRA|nr:TPA: hypothetical protein N0F65_001400 [Lagenidium giganteum]
MISCWFWFFGFALGITHSVLSETKDPGEEANCFGLVGAEVLLSIYQFLTSLYTLLQMFVIHFIYTSSTKWKTHLKMKRTKSQKIILAVFCVFGIAYLPIAWITAWNRRCPQGKPFFTAIQHYFYTTFLVVDGITSSISFYYARDILCRVNANMVTHAGKAGGAQTVPDASSSAKASAAASTAASTADETEAQPLTSSAASPKRSSVAASSPAKRNTSDMVAELANFYRFQCKVTLVSVGISCIFFIMQFQIQIRALSLVACVFCVLMYTTYALRRVPMLMKYLRDDHDWFPKTFALLWNTRHRNYAALPASSKVTTSIAEVPQPRKLTASIGADG